MTWVFWVFCSFVWKSRNTNTLPLSGCGAVGSAQGWGSWGRGFESRHPDQNVLIGEDENRAMRSDLCHFECERVGAWRRRRSPTILTSIFMYTYKTIDAYIAAQPIEFRAILENIRQTIKKTVPESEESISYGMPWYKYCGHPLVYFACGKNHFGFYPTPSGVEKFRDELSEYKTSKWAVQFPHNKPVPFDLIAKITTFRALENQKIFK